MGNLDKNSPTVVETLVEGRKSDGVGSGVRRGAENPNNLIFLWK
jgi:hypothetical protein